MDTLNNTSSEENKNIASKESSMNEELKEWIKQEKKNIEGKRIKKENLQKKERMKKA